MLNSFCVDNIIRSKITQHVNIFYAYQLPIPRLQSGNPFFDALVPCAARLTCTTHHFACKYSDPFRQKRLKNKRDFLHELESLSGHL
jgi:hypothetical protein